MHKRTRTLRRMFLLIVLFFLFLVLSLFPAFGSPDVQEYDFVDNNISNVDGVSDIGTHSNFTAQQYGPDSIYDTLTEENTGGGATWSNNTQPSVLILETDPDISGSAATHETYGLNNLASDDSTYGGGDVQDCGAVNDPQQVSLIMEFDYSGLGISGSDISYLRFEAEVYFIGGTGRAPVTDPWEMETTFYNGSVETYNWDSGSWEIMGTVFIDAPADLSIWDNTGDVNPERPLIRYKDSGFSDAHMSSSGYIRIRIQMTGVFQGTLYDGCSVIDYVDVDLQYGEENYELDLEVQWTNANYTQTYEELCIYGGTMGSEEIRVDVWNGSTWHNLFTDLSSGWNNVSVTDYLVSPTFTIRFKGGTETGDTSQDTWQIDCTLLHTWGVPPVANFSFSPPTPYTGEAVTFNASASYDPDGSIVSYFWDFGDGTNGTDVVTTHTYADDGNYTVLLTVTDNYGLSDITSADVIVLNRPPVATFTESAETVYTGETITFNASESYDPDGTIVSYFWDFGDGTNATGVTIEHAYTDNGNYTVTLTVTDDDGATDSASATKTVLNRPPVASFTESAETVYVDETITFNATDSYDPDGNIISYFWDFGDGSNATGVVVDHAYSDDGNYTVTLTVTDDDGTTASTNATKIILNRPPVASFTESAEMVYTGDVITFNASDSYDPDGSIVSYSWDFGDGNNATGVIVDHSYADDGIYTVTLTVTDDDDATASTNATKTILNRLPVASFTESAETVLTGELITFNASGSYDPDGYIVSYSWDFGDGTNATGVTVEHSYVDDGNYTVTLTVTDDDGATASTTATKTVLNRPPVAIFTESATTVLTGEVIYFNASDSYDPDGVIVSYFWDFGDGTNATGVTAEHAYANDGNYTVTLTVTDDDGANASTNATKTILNSPPVASFTESAETVYTDEVISFNASASYDPDGSIVAYLWDFGDGTNATGVVVDHTYTDDGVYNVTLTVTDEDGATASTSATKTILNRPPEASFTESATTVLTGETITFNASASYDPDGSVVSYFWDFGDGANATGVVVEHYYADDGVYNVTLTVTDNDGATGIATSTKTVLNRPPVAIFTESAETAYIGETITFNATDSYDPDGTIVSYFWDFGDGTNATGIIVDHAYATNGTYNVTLTVTDDDGATDSASATKTILINEPPVALFTESAETVYTSEAITFNATDSYDPDGTIVSYEWDFGDGTNATGVFVEHSYVDDGVYIVTLAVTDDKGATGTTNSTKTVLNRPPVASFTETAETVDTGETITFNASASYDPDGTIVSYFWDFGDGTNATGVLVEHYYADDGIYNVTLTVTDNDGATASTSATKTVLNRPPVATFTESATTVFTVEVIYFNASDSYDLDGTIVSYFWDFGDGTNSTGITAEHSYSLEGNYTVTLIVTDDDGATASTNAVKTVLNSPPVAIFTETAETVYTGETIAFNASDSYDTDGTIVSYFWDFGDGTNATGVTVEHSYVDDGNYTVTLTVTDDKGATGTATSTKTVLNRLPVAIFTESAETVVVDETIYFNASASYDPDGYIVSYFWDFGDGTNATGVTTEHAYADNGVYTVTLTVTDNDGANASATATKNVEVTPPVAIFTESAETVLTSETIYFNASDSYDPDGTIISYFWDFGDATNATGVVISHAYLDDGNYTVTLTVTDDDGATDTATSTKTVLNRAPVASFSETAETVYTNEVITFNASESNDSDGYIVSYFWDFGDGSNASGVIVGHAYADDGVYNVTLTVTDEDGATASTSATKTILNRPPEASFTESATTVLTGEVIYFNASASYDPDGYIASYFWDLGDGTNATGAIVEHSYVDDGNYTVTLTVKDDDGATATATSTKTVLNRPPVAFFTESAETVCINETITFDASNSYDADGYIVSYFWDFGDGTNATGVIVEHAYAGNGTYVVNLTVTDDDGETASANATKTVEVFMAHDIAITDVRLSANKVYAEELVEIYVDIRNEGMTNENFSVTAYYDDPPIGMQVISLATGANITLTFSWDTRGVTHGTYTIRAVATPVPEETDTADNTYLGGTVTIRILGDVNNNAKVNWEDLSDLGSAYGSQPGDSNWNPNADFDDSEKVDWEDLSDLGLNYGNMEWFVINHIIVWNETTYHISTQSNSTIWNFAFNGSLKEISFNVTGPNGTFGYCYVAIPNNLLIGPFTVLIDGTPTTPIYMGNLTHSILYLRYDLSTHKIQIIKTEQSSQALENVSTGFYQFPPVLVVAMAATIIFNRFRNRAKGIRHKYPLSPNNEVVLLFLSRF